MMGECVRKVTEPAGRHVIVVAYSVIATMRIDYLLTLLLLLAASQPSGLRGQGTEATPVEDDRPKILRTLRDTSPATATATKTTPLADSVTIVDVFMEGHKRTRDRVIVREMGLKRGARVPSADLRERVDLSYNTLMNTGLFASVEIAIDTLSADEVALVLQIRETWYLYPVPVFGLADRNFNVWFNENNASLDRVDIGAKLTYYNFTGRRDKFKIGFTTGYTREYEFSYNHPYVNAAGTLGLGLSYSFRRRREQNYLTVDNQQKFYSEEDNFVFRRTNVDLSLRYRKELFVTHRIELGYRNTSIADTIARSLNPDFFGGARNSQQFGRLAYFYSTDKRDVRNYPWAGYLISGSVEKEGLGITGERSGLTLGGTYAKFLPLSDKYSLNFGMAAKYSLIRTQQPFLENRAIGFGSNGLVGYQFYVVDGLDMLIWRAGIRREIFRAKLDLGKYAFIDAFRYVPIRLLFAVQFNQGFSNSPFVGEANPLTNRLLTGMSAGLDAVLYYDMVGSIQYNRNHLGEDGVFIALQLSF
ncbi:POTRA domain-containing protein [Neolewinella antarctica]|uniref:POTRA domain-containing protein n=1 Tax=Neolewinella antarctica TaxID=442734 RepID=A0ABX0X9X0_9BACT|nr:POTRA domain-containing protein [Neolewinella antarctica]NJC26086.1 hypothetical protein [Neolewinella antarctica]